MKKLPTLTFGVGDRFGLEGEAQLKAVMAIRERGVDAAPVWNKSFREHTLVEMLYGPQQQRFSQLKHQALPRQCRECDVLFACHGECPRNRFSTDRYGNPGLNYLCEGYRMFYHHAAPYMDFMARELAYQRPPANVMQAIRSGLLPAPPLAGQ